MAADELFGLRAQTQNLCCRDATQDCVPGAPVLPALGSHTREAIEYSRPGNRSLGGVPINPPEDARISPDGAGTDARMKASRTSFTLWWPADPEIGRGRIDAKTASAAASMELPRSSLSSIALTRRAQRPSVTRTVETRRRLRSYDPRELGKLIRASPTDAVREIAPKSPGQTEQATRPALWRSAKALLEDRNDTRPDS